MGDYIGRDDINQVFEGIYDCGDLVFEPNDYCCSIDDCGSCKWAQTKNAIKKLFDHIPAADVRPVVRGKWIKKGCYAFCPNCGERIAIAWSTTVEELVNVYRLKFCNNCGADMREVKTDG